MLLQSLHRHEPPHDLLEVRRHPLAPSCCPPFPLAATFAHIRHGLFGLPWTFFRYISLHVSIFGLLFGTSHWILVLESADAVFACCLKCEMPAGKLLLKRQPAAAALQGWCNTRVPRSKHENICKKRSGGSEFGTLAWVPLLSNEIEIMGATFLTREYLARYWGLLPLFLLLCVRLPPARIGQLPHMGTTCLK